MSVRSDYYGLPVRTIASRHLTVEYLAEAGPRLVGLRLAGHADNLLAETPDEGWDTPFGTYRLYGGHRLWHAPEAVPRSSVPDESGLAVVETSGGVRLEGPVEAYTGIRKTIALRLDPGWPALQVNHTLTNEGPWPVELAPWAITQVPLGGVAVLPQPGPVAESARVTPNRILALWPYTHLSDPRLDLRRDDFWLVVTMGPAQPCKLGYFNRHGWLAYRRRGLLLVKRFTPQPGQPHVDGGCNVEVFAGLVTVELETLGPLCRLEPGQAIEHAETWEVYAEGDELPADLAALATLDR